MRLFGGKPVEPPQGLLWQQEEDLLLQGPLAEEEAWEVECAWCLQERGIAAGSGSHGICERHAQQVYQSYQATRETRRRGRE